MGFSSLGSATFSSNSPGNQSCLPFPWWMLMMFKFDAKQIRVNSVSMVPWKLRSRGKNCLVLTHSMSFRVSHIFREGNGCTDTLANYAIHENGFTWWI